MYIYLLNCFGTGVAALLPLLGRDDDDENLKKFNFLKNKFPFFLGLLSCHLVPCRGFRKKN